MSLNILTAALVHTAGNEILSLPYQALGLLEAMNFLPRDYLMIILKRKNLISIHFPYTLTYATTKLVSSTDLVSCMRCIVKKI